MLKSMTGFAAITSEDEAASVAVTVKTVNHRYLDVQLRVPQSLAASESAIRALIAKAVARGRVELAVSCQLRQAPGVEVEFNEAFGRALSVAIDQAREQRLVDGVLTPGDLLRLPQALTIRERQADGHEQVARELGAQVCSAVAQALTDVDTMRTREGDQLRLELDRRRLSVADLVERIDRAADQGREQVQKRLAARVKELRQDLPVDETAVAQEIVRTAARSDISEEIARFRAHVTHWAALVDGPEPCGRKLDFLLQEMNREVNTMGSKADGLSVSELIINAKAELEKMREQVQNVE